MLDLLGIGNAIVDTDVEVEESFLLVKKSKMMINSYLSIFVICQRLDKKQE